jgi:hypothetical protein
VDGWGKALSIGNDQVAVWGLTKITDPFERQSSWICSSSRSNRWFAFRTRTSVAKISLANCRTSATVAVSRKFALMHDPEFRSMSVI